MMLSRRRFLCAAAAVLAAPSAAPIASAQSTYPTRPVRVIVPFPPGGGTDTFARLAAQKLGARFGQQFYVENIAGAGGNIGTGQAARAKPDGYTVLFAFGSFAVNPSLYATVPYNPLTDFEPVTLAVATPTTLVIHPSVPAGSVGELIELIKTNPGKYSYAHGGFGTPPHLAGEQFRLSLALDLVHVPYSGAGPANAAVLANHTPIGFTSLGAAAPYLKDGRLRALAVSGKTRSPALPDVPTMAEAGLPEIEGDSWVGVLLPAGTAKDIIALLHGAIVQIMAHPDMTERLATLGYEPIASTPQDFATRIKLEVETWARVIRSAGIKTL